MGMKSNFDNRTASRLFCCAQTDDPRNPFGAPSFNLPSSFLSKLLEKSGKQTTYPVRVAKQRGTHTHIWSVIVHTDDGEKHVKARVCSPIATEQEGGPPSMGRRKRRCTRKRDIATVALDNKEARSCIYEPGST